MNLALQHMLRHGYATALEYPELHDQAKRDRMGQIAKELGLVLSYDLSTQTAALTLSSDEEAYSPIEQATILICWQYTTYRQKLHGGNGLAFVIRSEQLAKDFPNVYRNSGVAGKALRALHLKGLLMVSGDGFTESPLLRHVVDEPAATALIDGELAGAFDYLKSEPGDTPEDQILHIIRSVAPEPATKEILQERTKIPYREVKSHLQHMEAEGSIESVGHKRRRGYVEVIDE